MKTLSSLGFSVVTLIGSLGLGACSGVRLEPVDEPVVDDVPKSVTSLVNASSVVSACPDNKRMNARAAANANRATRSSSGTRRWFSKVLMSVQTRMKKRC